MNNKIRTSVVAASVAFGLSLVGCGQVAKDDTAQCKEAAEQVYQKLLKADTMEEAMAIGLQYGGTGGDEKLRETLPECKTLSVAETEKLEKELESSELFKKTEAHVTALWMKAE